MGKSGVNKELVAKRNQGRQILFKCISIALPFVVLVLFECSLRVFGYGYQSDLFVDYPADPHFLMFNPNASRKYFTHASVATVGNVELFRKEKSAKSFRIFVLGESTTIGYPYFHNGSFHRWLQYRLLHTFPEQDFEIVNVSLTAVNSHTILGFTKEVVNYEPDAVLIYAGHNEYYGTLGVASTEKLGGNRRLINMILWLKEFRTVQLISSLVERFENRTPSSGTRMKMMVAEGEIPMGSELYDRGVAQFETNLGEALSILHQQNIPTFVSNLVSNEKDLTPFVSFQPKGKQFPSFRKNYEQGVKAYRKNQFDTATRYLSAAHDVYDRNAHCEYLLGKLMLADGEEEKAKTYFLRARDLDGLRFRAPGKLDDVIDALCRQYPNAHLVDTRSLFETNSADHIIGDDLILEHVHPNLRGYALMSDAFYQSMKKGQLLAVSPEREMTFDQLIKDMPVTKIDSISAAFKIRALRHSWPFNAALSGSPDSMLPSDEALASRLAQKKISWRAATDSLYTNELNHHNYVAAKRVMESLVLEYPQDESLYENAAMLSGKSGDEEKALIYFRKAFEKKPTVEKAKYLLALYLKKDRPADAVPFLDYAIDNRSNPKLFRSIRQHVQRIIPLEAKARENAKDVSVLLEIAHHYLAIENHDGVSMYVEKVLRIDPSNEDAKSLQQRIVKM